MSGGESGATGRYARENFNPAGYERELAGLLEALKDADASVPATAQDLVELERLVARYPEHARRLLAAQDEPKTAVPPRSVMRLPTRHRNGGAPT